MYHLLTEEAVSDVFNTNALIQSVRETSEPERSDVLSCQNLLDEEKERTAQHSGSVM